MECHRLVPCHGPILRRGAAGSRLAHRLTVPYDISQDIGDVGFPDDPTGISITGPGSPVPVWSVPQVLTPYDAVAAFLGAWDCYRVMSFTIPRAGSYRVSIKDRSGMSGAWISEPYTRVVRQLVPWALGFVAALITIAVCLIVSVVRWRPGEADGTRQGHP